MPNIEPLEVVVVTAGFLVLCVVPVLVAWSDALARRRLQRREAMTVPAPAVGAEGETAAPYAGTLTDLPSSGVASPQPAASVVGPESRQESPGPAAPTDVAAGQTVPPEVAAPPVATTEEGGSPYEFRLQDLRRARLLDWPPAAIRENAERYRVWQDGAHLAATRQGQIDAATLRGTYRPQSACLGSVEVGAAGMRLRYLLFSDLWPVAESQAVGDAVFEIDSVGGGEVRGWLEPHRPVS